MYQSILFMFFVTPTSVGGWPACFILSGGHSLLSFFIYITSLQISVKVERHSLTAPLGKVGSSVSEGFLYRL